MYKMSLETFGGSNKTFSAVLQFDIIVHIICIIEAHVLQQEWLYISDPPGQMWPFDANFPWILFDSSIVIKLLGTYLHENESNGTNEQIYGSAGMGYCFLILEMMDYLINIVISSLSKEPISHYFQALWGYICRHIVPVKSRSKRSRTSFVVVGAESSRTNKSCLWQTLVSSHDRCRSS